MHPGGRVFHAIASATMDLTPDGPLGERDQDINTLPTETVGTTHQHAELDVHKLAKRCKHECNTRWRGDPCVFHALLHSLPAPPLGRGKLFQNTDSKYFRFVCIHVSKFFKNTLRFGSKDPQHSPQEAAVGRRLSGPVHTSDVQHYVGDTHTVARARGGVRNTLGFTVMSPPGAPGGCGEARGVPHLNKRNVATSAMRSEFRV
jgi:hypothetical protein